MKTLFGALVVLALVCPAYADTTILSEDFDGNGGTAPGVGTALTSLGWTGASNIAVSAATIDQGQSAAWADGSTAWPAVTKMFYHTPVAGEVYTLTATLYAPTTNGADSFVQLRNSGNPSVLYVDMEIAYGELDFGRPNDSDKWFTITPQPTVATDVKAVLHGTTGDFYYRTNGVSAWTYVGEKTGIAVSIDAWDTVAFGGHGGVAGGIDSILLTSSVPEPSSLVLLGAGLIGLLCYAWRKRK